MAADYELEYGKKLSDEDLVEYFWTCHRASKEHFGPIWDEYDRQAEAYAGNTLDDIDRQWLEETKRPPITFNIFAATIDTIIGTDMADEREVIFRGQDISDLDGIKGEWLTGLLRGLTKRSKMARRVTDAFQDDLLGGYGFLEIYLDTSRVPIPLAGKHAPVWEMWPDPDAGESCLTDGRFITRERRWLLEEIESRWGDKVEDIQLSLGSGKIEMSPRPSSAGSGTWSRNRSLQRQQGTMVYHFCYKRYEPRVVVEEPPGSGNLVQHRPERWKEISEERERQFQEAMAAWEAGGGPMSQTPPPEPGQYQVDAPAHRFAAEVFYSSYILGSESEGAGMVLEHNELSVPMFPYLCLTGYKKRKASEGRTQFFGPAKKIFDAQMYLNRALGLYVDILARGAKGGFFIDKDLVHGNPEALIKDLSIPGMSHIVEGDPREGILPKPTQTTPTGYEGFLGMCIDAISRISLVTDWLKGTATQERSNVLITNLQNQATTGLAPLYAPLGEFRENLGVLMIRLALAHLPVDEINRTIGEVDPVEGLTHEMMPDPETGEPTLQPILIEDPEAEGGQRPITPYDILAETDPLDYDVVVEVGAASTNQKMQVWTILSSGDFLGKLVELLGPAIQPLIPDLIRNFPLPATMVKSMAEKLEMWSEQQEMMQTREGLLEALSQMPPEEQLALLQEASGSMNIDSNQPIQ